MNGKAKIIDIILQTFKQQESLLSRYPKQNLKVFSSSFSNICYYFYSYSYFYD